MRVFRTRTDDSTFQLNLAPMLDIIVSITPMLLLSVVFMKINMIESPLPQPVQHALAKQAKDHSVSIELRANSNRDLNFVVNANGKKFESQIPSKNGAFDLVALKNEAVVLKNKYPQIFRVDLYPQSKVPLKDLVFIMDSLRNVGPKSPEFAFNDPKTGKLTKTDLMFPSVIFANAMGD